MIDAAARLFVRDGYAATSQRSIAVEAGVSVPTVQLQGPKHTLLVAAFERTFAGDEGRGPLAERPSIAAIMAEPDFETALARYVEFLVDANARSASIARAMMAAADADGAARSAYEDLEARRMRDMALAAAWFASRGRIDDARTDVATDVLSHITGPDTYMYFHHSCRWDTQKYAAWVAHQLRHLHELCTFAD